MTQILVCRNKFMFDGFRDNFNHSVRLMKNIRAMGQYDWIGNGSFLWNGTAKVPLVEVFTKRGLGFNFNMQDSSKLFKLSE